MNMNNLLNEENEGYSWEGDYEKTWEALQEDESGTLRSAIDDQTYRYRKRQLLEKQSHIRLSMMRHMYIVIDASACMNEKDLKPSRFFCVIKLLEKFAHSYFDQNPISQLGLILTFNKTAEKVSDLVGNPKKFIDKLHSLKNKICQGEPSIQNSLELASYTLKNIQSNSSREVMIVMGSLTTCDPSDIFATIEDCKKHKIRFSIVGLAAEVHVCKKICQELEGIYSVIIDELHLHDMLQKVAFPLPNTDEGAQTLMRMGFPKMIICSQDDVSLCMCHLENNNDTRFSTGGYFCPVCESKYCELPIECKVCGLTLVMAPHLARSYHHLFPLDPYKEISNLNTPIDDETPVTTTFIYENCFGCQQDVSSEKNLFQCNACKNVFCIECDIFIHETLHSCPSCTNALN